MARRKGGIIPTWGRGNCPLVGKGGNNPRAATGAAASLDSSGTGTRHRAERGPRESREEHEIADGQPRGRGRGGEEMTTVWGHGEPRRASAGKVSSSHRKRLMYMDMDKHCSCIWPWR